jgi:NAD+ synthase
MNRVKDYRSLAVDVVGWLCNYANENKVKSFVVGVSGGIDSAVSSTLAAKTGRPVYAIGMPLNQSKDQETLSDAHLYWLECNYPNVKRLKADLSETYAKLMTDLTDEFTMEYTGNPMAKANTKSRLRMVTLYHVAANVGGIVVGTGNKVEDYGVGFYTKYGDGGVDIAPIADLYKTEVWELGEYLEVDQRIVNADPTDGLWSDSRTDESQLGASYAELEEAMETGAGPGVAVLEKFNTQNKHKMEPIPTFKL